jgi:hypothetical protein
VRITHSPLSPSALIDMIAANLDRASPEMAVFRKTRGPDDSLRHGDEFVVRMPGPWDSPVRVVHSPGVAGGALQPRERGPVRGGELVTELNSG